MPIYRLIGTKWTLSQKLVQAVDEQSPLLKILPLFSRKLSTPSQVPSMKNFRLFATKKVVSSDNGTEEYKPSALLNVEMSLQEQGVSMAATTSGTDNNNNNNSGVLYFAPIDEDVLLIDGSICFANNNNNKNESGATTTTQPQQQPVVEQVPAIQPSSKTIQNNNVNNNNNNNSKGDEGKPSSSSISVPLHAS